MVYDILVIGGGPAGLSAALTAANRGKHVGIISDPNKVSRMRMAHRIDNVLGHGSVAGEDLWKAYVKQVQTKGVTWIEGTVDEIIHGDSITVVLEEDVLEAHGLILAMGASTQKELPRESDFVGRGVSYCATCDGNFFKDKTIAVWMESLDHMEEVEFLQDVASEVYLLVSPSVEEEWSKFGGISLDRVTVLTSAHIVGLVGDEVLTGIDVSCEGERLHVPVEALFIFRPMKALGQIIEGLSLEGSCVVVTDHMATNLPGVFAAGDIVGPPWQVDTAIGRGQVAALEAISYLRTKKQD